MKCRAMSILLMIIITVCLVNSNLFAQDTTKTEKNNSLEKGKWALLFGLSKDLTLTSHIGGLISLKKHTSDSRAIRIGLNMGGQYLNYSTTRIRSGNVEDDWRYETDEPTTFNISLILQRLYYKPTTNRSAVYFGVGPVVGWQYDSRNNHFQDDNAPEGKAVVTNFLVKGGIAGAIGAEWFPTKSLSISGEYTISANFMYQENKLTQESYFPNNAIIYSSSRNCARTLSIQSDGVRMGFSIYFD